MRLRGVVWRCLFLFLVQCTAAVAAEEAAGGRPCIAYLIGIGTQKGGTSSMHIYMQQGIHPRLRASRRKELSFWCGEQFTGGYTLQDYDQMFQKNETVVDSVAFICPPPGSSMPRSAPRNPCSASMRTCTVQNNTPSWGEDVYLGWNISQDALPPLKAEQLDPFYLSENSPQYLFDPRVPARVFGHLPEARFYVILRNPVSRAISAFNMMYSKRQHALAAEFDLSAASASERKALWAKLLHEESSREIQELQACYNKTGATLVLQPEFYTCLGYGNGQNNRRYSPVRMDKRFVYNSVYADGLERWMSLYPARHFLIWNSEDFKARTSRHILDMVTWLGLDPAEVTSKFKHPESKLRSFHRRKYVGAAPEATIRMLHEFYEPHNQRLFSQLRAKGFGSVAARMEELWRFDSSSSDEGPQV